MTLVKPVAPKATNIKREAVVKPQAPIKRKVPQRDGLAKFAKSQRFIGG